MIHIPGYMRFIIFCLLYIFVFDESDLIFFIPLYYICRLGQSVSQTDLFHHYNDIPVIKKWERLIFFLYQFCVEGCSEAIILLYLRLYLINLDF